MKKLERLRKDSEIRNLLSKARIIVRTALLPCESREKVERALKNVLDGDVETERIGDRTFLIIEDYGLTPIEKIFLKFRSRQVLAALRKFLIKYSREDLITFYLHKQAAYQGTLTLSEPGESPGGEIIVNIEVKNAGEVIRWMTRF